MPHMDTTAFGLPPPGDPSPTELLARAEQVNKGLLTQFRETAQVLVRIIEVAGEVRDGKSLGCERCSSCTLRISQIAEEWLRTPPFDSPDALTVNLTKFVGFPRALVRLIEACLSGVKRVGNTRPVDGVLITELSELCDWAEDSHRNARNHFLPFCRVAGVFGVLHKDLSNTLGKYSGWQELDGKIKALLENIRSVEGQLDDTAYREQRWKDANHTEMHDAEKRICGGGAMRPHRIKGQPDPRPIFVVDFSKDHILGIVDRPMENPQLGWEFFPCPRELAFSVDFKPVRRNGQKDHPEVGDSPLRNCGKFYQVFRITRIEPRYYYYSLCAHSPSNHPMLTDARLVDTYDWPEAPALRV